MRLTALRPGWPVLVVAAMFLATWPVWRWYVLRFNDGSDEPWGLLALATLAVLVTGRGQRTAFANRLAGPASCLAIYAVTFPVLPPLIRAALAASAFGALFIDRRGGVGKWGLLALSLPLVATLQFYAGYPLRILAAGASAATLRLCGFAVTREGSLLHWAGETVMVDAPCSGIQMLWFGFYLTFLLAAYYRLSAARTLLSAAATLVIVVGANMARATALFFKEAHIVAWPEWTHAGVGLVCFSGAAWGVAVLAEKLQPSRCAP